MYAQNLNQGLNLCTEFFYLNTETNKNFLTKYVTILNYFDKDIIYNGSVDDKKALNIIGNGTVRIVKPVLSNNSIVSYDLGVGDIFGIEDIICNGGHYPMFVSSVGDTMIYRINKDDILTQLKDTNALMGLFNHYIRTLNHVIHP
jgi:hypothetical protein